MFLSFSKGFDLSFTKLCGSKILEQRLVQYVQLEEYDLDLLSDQFLEPVLTCMERKR